MRMSSCRPGKKTDEQVGEKDENQNNKWPSLKSCRWKG